MLGVRVWTIERGGKCESSARKTPIGLFGPSRERLRSRTLPPGDCSLSARSHQETERGLGLACVFVPLFLDPQIVRQVVKEQVVGATTTVDKSPNQKTKVKTIP